MKSPSDFLYKYGSFMFRFLNVFLHFLNSFHYVLYMVSFAKPRGHVPLNYGYGRKVQGRKDKARNFHIASHIARK